MAAIDGNIHCLRMAAEIVKLAKSIDLIIGAVDLQPYLLYIFAIYKDYLSKGYILMLAWLLA